MKMETGNYILVGLIASIITILIVTFITEKKDINAMSMYLIVYLVPTIILNVLNGLLLKIATKLKRIKYQRILTLIPIVICFILIFGKELKLLFIDGSISSIGLIGLVGIGLTNVIWNINLQKNSNLKIDN